ncbi:hypothetical protein Ahy_B10g102875 [Arachis hypogaea]|uniref:Transposase MuDR plant domain-containing protein n=1 Tax=Arachis hypogaea TaxID=3818 RepID=A0A444X2N0_ARAHY|nr:hypothetical protein Ahy_B10g102875 [Arachis hypogaea]
MYKGAQFVCDNPLDVVIPNTLSFEELKGMICEKIDPQISRKVSCILYRYPLSVFGGFVQFQTKYVMDEASMHEMFSMYIENCHRMSCIEMYIEFEQSEANRNIELEDYNSDSEEEFKSHYEIVGLGEEEDEADGTMNADVAEVANVLANQQPFQEPSFMRSLDLEAMHAPEFPQYMNAKLPVVVDGEFMVGMEFSSREAVIKAMKDYTIRRGVDYRVFESEPTTFYAKCTQYGAGCDWLIRVTKMQKKYYWKIRRYNGSQTCTRSSISQDHSKLDSKTVAEEIKPLVEVDPSIKVKSVIAEVQSKFNYTISYRKAWLAKQKAVESIFGGWEASYEALPIWFEAMCHKEPSAVVHFETMPAYQGDDLVPDIRVDGTHLYEKYKGCLLVAISQDGNNNIVPIAFAIVEEETYEAWYFFLSNLRQHVVTRDGVGLISDRHNSIRSTIARSNEAWSPPRAFHIEPSISLQSTRVALHNDLFKCARHAEPQLNCMIPAKLRSKRRNFQCTAAPDLSPNRIVPNNNIIQHCAILQTPNPREFYKASSTVCLSRCNTKVMQALGLQDLKTTHGWSCNRNSICRQTENHRHILQRHGTLTNRKMKCVSLWPPSLDQSINHC